MTKSLCFLSVPEILRSDYYSENQTSLAWALGISRGTLRKYMNDTENKNHVVIVRDGKYTFMSATIGAKFHQSNKG